MKSFINIQEIAKQEFEATFTGRDGKPAKRKYEAYPEAGITDILAQWLIQISTGRQNKYVVCSNWDVTRGKEFDERGINDLSPDAQDWVFTMVYLLGATKDNAIIPSRDGEENTLAKDYSIPSAKNIKSLLTFSHRVGISELLAELDKFVVETKATLMIDKSRILSPSGCDAFVKEHKNSGSATDMINTTPYATTGVKQLHELEGFFTKDDFSQFEATLNDNPSVKREVSQLLLITGTGLKGMGRTQEVSSNEVLVRWLANTDQDTSSVKND